jgi:hypothetical protein
MYEGNAAPSEAGRITVSRRDVKGGGASLPGGDAGGASGSYHLTDAGNSERLVRLHGDAIRYCEPQKQWFVWDGHRWIPDDS